MVFIEIADPEKALQALDRLTVNDRGVQFPSDTTVFSWKKNLREKIEQAMAQESTDETV